MWSRYPWENFSFRPHAASVGSGGWCIETIHSLSCRKILSFRNYWDQPVSINFEMLVKDIHWFLINIKDYYFLWLIYVLHLRGIYSLPQNRILNLLSVSLCNVCFCMICCLYRFIVCCYYFTFRFCFQISSRHPWEHIFFINKLYILLIYCPCINFLSYFFP